MRVHPAVPLPAAPLPGAPLRGGLFACALAAVALVVAANAWAAAYVGAERTIYAWDWANYWLMFQDFARLLQGDPVGAAATIRQSVATNESSVLPVLPLMPFALLFGPGRLSYILAITDMAVLPAALLMALVVARATGRGRGGSWPRLLLGTAAILGLHVLWAPALRGLPDAVGVVLACLVLFLYRSDAPQGHRPLRLAAIGLLLCLLVLTRRYYLFWAASFFPAAALGWLAAHPDRTGWFAAARALAVVAIACAAGLLILAAPLIGHIATTDYAAAYAAYRTDQGGAAQVAGHFGPALLALCTAGLVRLAIRRSTRSLGVLLLVQALLAFALFGHVQALFGVHHFLILVPAAGIGLAAIVAALCEARVPAGWRIAGIAGVFAVVLASAASVFAPASARRPLLPDVRYPPLTRPDLGEIRRLLAVLAALRPAHVYVAASSQEVNSAILAMGCRTLQPAPCPPIATTQDIDTRDGFPVGILDADHVVLATPTQYHVAPRDQRVVGRVADAIRSGRGIGASFRRLPGGFALARGVRITLYRRVAPLDPAAVQALGRALARDHPGMARLFVPPAARTVLTPR